MKKISYISYIIIFTTILTLNPQNIHAKTITDGTYTIRSAINNNAVIETTGGQTEDGTNIQVYTSNNTDAQKWIITYGSDNYYTIASSLNKNKVIDIQNGTLAIKNNIQLYTSNNTNAQKWQITEAGNGYFYIKNKNTNYCIDFKDGKSHNGNNVWLYTCNNSIAQQFKLVQEVTPEQTIENGLYTINSKLNNNKVLDVAGGSTTNKSNIQLFDSNNTASQKWNITYQNNGYYTITSQLNSQKCIDIKDGNFISNNNVWLYDCNNSDAQKFIIKKTEDDYYQIFTSKYPIPIDIAGASTKNGTNVQIYYNNNSDAQKFKFTKLEQKELDNGTYTISTELNSQQVMDTNGGSSFNNTTVQIYQSNNTNAQKWYINKENDGYYTIRSGLNSANYLSYDQNAKGANIRVSEKETKWKLEYIDSNKFYIISKDGNFNLTTNNNKLTLSSRTENKNQQFRFETTQINQEQSTISNSYYILETSQDQNKAIDIGGGSKTNGTNIQIYQKNTTNAQIWYVKHIGNGYYKITSAMNPDITLDLSGGSTSNGTNIQLYKSNGTDSQIWKLKDDGKGNLSIVSKKANICLNINNSNINTTTCNNTLNQKFKFKRYTDKLTYTGIDISSYQKDINWEKLAQTNIGFVIIRLGYGDNFDFQDDNKFQRNVEGCLKYNIPYAVYLFSYAQQTNGTTELNKDSKSAASEAQHTIRVLNSVSYKPNLKTQVYIDMEDHEITLGGNKVNKSSLGKNTLTSIVKSFCNTVQNKNYKCGVYANVNWLTNYLNTQELSNYDTWVAHYTGYNSFTDAAKHKPSYSNYKIWQFSNTGKINGISGNVDLDIGYNIFD